MGTLGSGEVVNAATVAAAECEGEGASDTDVAAAGEALLVECGLINYVLLVLG